MKKNEKNGVRKATRAAFLRMAKVAAILALVPIPVARGAVVPAITDITKSGDDVVLVWDAFGDGQYTVQHTDDLRGAWQPVPGTAWPVTASSWTHVGVLSSTAMGFYRVESGGVYTDPVGFVTVEAVRDGLTMISVLLLWDPPAAPLDNMLNGPIGDMIGENLSGGTGGMTGAAIWRWNPLVQNYNETAFLIDGWPPHDGNWYDEWAGDFSAMTFDLGEGCWVRRTHWGPDMATIIFLGWVPTAGTIPLTLGKGLTMFNWPYPTRLALNDSSLRGVGHGGASPTGADIVRKWDPVAKTYKMAFLVDLPGHAFHGKWFDPDAGNLSDIEFIPGTAMWYDRKPDDAAVWVCTRPY